MMDTIVLTQSIRNIMSGAGAILGPVAAFASTPAGIAVFGALLVSYLEQRAQRLEYLLANDPGQLSNTDLGLSWIWNATLGAPIDLVTDPIGGVTERVNTLREVGSRITGWLSDNTRMGNTSN